MCGFITWITPAALPCLVGVDRVEVWGMGVKPKARVSQKRETPKSPTHAPTPSHASLSKKQEKAAQGAITHPALSREGVRNSPSACTSTPTWMIPTLPLISRHTQTRIPNLDDAASPQAPRLAVVQPGNALSSISTACWLCTITWMTRQAHRPRARLLCRQATHSRTEVT